MLLKHFQNEYYLLSEEAKPVNGDSVFPDSPNEGVWTFWDMTGKGSAPMPYWANAKTCKKIIASTKRMSGIFLIDRSKVKMLINNAKEKSDSYSCEMIWIDHERKVNNQKFFEYISNKSFLAGYEQAMRDVDKDTEWFVEIERISVLGYCQDCGDGTDSPCDHDDCIKWKPKITDGYVNIISTKPS